MRRADAKRVIIFDSTAVSVKYKETVPHANPVWHAGSFGWLEEIYEYACEPPCLVLWPRPWLLLLSELAAVGSVLA